jgi:type II secretory pathway pseudopilin PulG
MRKMKLARDAAVHYSSSHRSSFPSPRQAFTIRELLAVTAIISGLLAILVPTIQTAREKARATQCQNNLKQIGLGVQNYEDIRKEIVPSYLTADHTAAALPGGYATWSIVILPFFWKNKTWPSQSILASR